MLPQRCVRGNKKNLELQQIKRWQQKKVYGILKSTLEVNKDETKEIYIT